MKQGRNRLLAALLLFLAAALLWGMPANNSPPAAAPARGAAYGTAGEVTAYLRAYGELPPNYITKAEARALGWDAAAGNLWEVAAGRSIGGDRFGNREGLLPARSGRVWYECDIEYAGGRRNGKRLVYSDDGLYYYTQDHYQTFTQME